MDQSLTVEIAASPAGVFAHLTDHELSKRWVEGWVSSEYLTEQKLAVGSRSRIIIAVNDYQKVIEQEVVKLEANRFISSHGRCEFMNEGRSLSAFSFRQSYELIDSGDLCTLIWRYATTGRIRVWSAVGAGLLYARPNEPPLERLKHVIEAMG